jgi:hypothetical protein
VARAVNRVYDRPNICSCTRTPVLAHTQRLAGKLGGRGRLQALAGDFVGLGLQVGAAGAAFEEAGEDGLDEAAEDDLGASVVDALALPARVVGFGGEGSAY